MYYTCKYNMYYTKFQGGKKRKYGNHKITRVHIPCPS